ncbi:MAG: hypothetical protein R8K49_02285 [Mariprofundaceae bacterium]
MKINSTQGITPKSRASTKKTSSTKFSSLFSSELESPSTPMEQNTPEDSPSKHETQPRQLVEQATELLDQALSQLDTGELLDESTLSSIQQVSQQLQALSKDNPNSSSLTQAEILLAVEAKRIQSMKH